MSEGGRVGVGGAWALGLGRLGHEPGRLCHLLLCNSAWSLNLAELQCPHRANYAHLESYKEQNVRYIVCGQ